MDQSILQELSQGLSDIENFARELESRYAEQIEKVSPDAQDSARNLLHYLALRNKDISAYQDGLSELGISSLQHAESHVLANISAVQSILHHYQERSYQEARPLITIREGKALRKRNRKALLGSESQPKRAYIMVTMDTDMADDYALVHAMLAAGMDCARINCAKDDADIWKSIIAHVHTASKELKKPCKILMDLGGPKIRTGSIQKGPRLIQIKPERDKRGETISPALLKLVTEIDTSEDFLQVPVEQDWLAQLHAGDRIRFEDTRNVKQEAKVVEIDDQGAIISFEEEVFIETGLSLEHWQDRKKIASINVGKLPSSRQKISLKKGDTLILHKNKQEGEPARYDEQGQLTSPAHISCTLPEVFKSVKKDQAIRFDDGKIEGIVRKTSEDELHVEITHAKNGKRSLKENKGINFPETDLQISGLTEKDKQDLDFVVKHADIVNLSFVRRPEDVSDFLHELQQRGAKNIGIMLKIETEEAVNQLPWLLLRALQHYPLGVMIARGDLAVEIGWERMSVLQEEILWLCQAAHIPNVWATQVLEGVAKKGIPKRAEITDAAMADQADCIMLNKGDYIIKAIKMLGEISRKVVKQEKKSSSIVQNLDLKGK
ncbi:pyruvate kinase [Catalinimonas alkaloidigena]|uniref:pyruvate kinase n=1 Tax=Catalinimonas alkaloidigena TaxID=1075417 RepID=UPI00240521B3|nr:pyruvate kinase [Catalinimonas alkaloidigena]MDF9796769.1 pyruvate kinase [Catalinimonas alkaloidigena]